MSDNDQQATSQDNSTSAASSTGSNNNDCARPLPEPDPMLVYRVAESVDRDRNNEEV